MTTLVQPCMGGLCTMRERCARYWEQSPRAPAERLCTRGDQNAFLPIGARRSASGST